MSKYRILQRGHEYAIQEKDWFWTWCTSNGYIKTYDSLEAAQEAVAKYKAEDQYYINRAPTPRKWTVVCND